MPGGHGYPAGAPQGQPGPGYPPPYPPPYPQQPYGPPPGGMPPGPPRGNKRRIWLWLAPLLVVVVAAAVIVPIVLTSGEDGATASSPAAEQPMPQWRVEAEERSGPGEPEKLNTWVVDDSIVVAAGDKVTAYARADGQQRWQVEPPAAGGQFCGTATRVVDGKIPFAFSKTNDGPYPACEFATVLDVRSGKLGWQRKIDAPQSVSPEDPSEGAALELVGGTMVIAQDGGMVGLDLNSGQRRWQKGLVRQPDKEDACEAKDMVPRQGDVLITMHCLDEAYSLSVLAVDSGSGDFTKQKHFSLDQLGIKTLGSTVVSTKPLVLAVNGSKGQYSGGYLMLDESFNKITAVDFGAPPEGLSQFGPSFFGLASASGHEYYPVLVTDRLLVTVSAPAPGKRNKAVALDLKTGKKVWSTPAPAGTRMAGPVAVDGDSVIVAASPATAYEPGAQSVLRFGLSDGKLKSTEKHRIRVSRDNPDAPNALFYRYFWTDGRLYAVKGGGSPSSVALYTMGK